MTTQKAAVTPESIRDLLTRSDAAVERALLVLYERQTADEQASETTKYVNGRGFNAVDAEILSSFACQVERKVGQTSSYLGRERKLGECLSPKQMAIARRKVVRYVKQLAEVAEAKAAAPVDAWKNVSADLPKRQPVARTLEEELAQVTEEYERESVRPITYYDGRPVVNILYYRMQELKRLIAQKDKEAKKVADEASRLALSGKADEAAALIERFVDDNEAEAEMEMAGADLEREMWAMEAAGDREGTLRDERAKAEARQAMEKGYVDYGAPGRKAAEEEPFHQGHSAKIIQADPEARTFRSVRNDILAWSRK
jgi:hypothetical protein